MSCFQSHLFIVSYFISLSRFVFGFHCGPEAQTQFGPFLLGSVQSIAQAMHGPSNDLPYPFRESIRPPSPNKPFGLSFFLLRRGMLAFFSRLVPIHAKALCMVCLLQKGNQGLCTAWRRHQRGQPCSLPTRAHVTHASHAGASCRPALPSYMFTAPDVSHATRVRQYSPFSLGRPTLASHASSINSPLLSGCLFRKAEHQAVSSCRQVLSRPDQLTALERPLPLTILAASSPTPASCLCSPVPSIICPTQATYPTPKWSGLLLVAGVSHASQRMATT